MMTPTPLLALFVAASSNSTYTPTFPGGFIAWIVCYSTRRRAFGGFLMLYYWSLYSGAFVSLLFFWMSFQSYVPESFQDPKLYHLLLLSTVPTLIIFCIEVIVATMLLAVPTWDMLRLLRGLILVQLIFAMLGLAIDLWRFPDSTFFDGYTIVLSSIWLAYFFFSKRVAHVFRIHDWESVVGRIYPMKTPKPVKVN
jgi:hypothetical protein